MHITTNWQKTMFYEEKEKKKSWMSEYVEIKYLNTTPMTEDHILALIQILFWSC